MVVATWLPPRPVAAAAKVPGEPLAKAQSVGVGVAVSNAAGNRTAA